MRTVFSSSRGLSSVYSAYHRVIFERTSQSYSNEQPWSAVNGRSPRIYSCDNMNEVKEGKASVLFPKSVFYNPVQEFNRDLTIAVISQFVKDKQETEEKERQVEGNSSVQEDRTSAGNVETNEKEKSVDGKQGTYEDAKRVSSEISEQVEKDRNSTVKSCENGVRILEGLAASGLRSMRFGLEIPGVKEIIANDFDHFAVTIIEKNIQKNNLTGVVKANFGDAAMVMYQSRGFKDKFDVIDLDPYGSPHLFLDAVVQAVHDGGLLCITCTDAAVLCGKTPETCFSKYGAVSLAGKFCHEMGLRIILQCLESHANRYSRYTEPVLSVKADFYFRVFVKVYSGQRKVKKSGSKMAMVYHCHGCGAFQLQRLMQSTPTRGGGNRFTPGLGPPVEQRCQHCDYTHQVGGPMWAMPMHDTEFVGRVLQHVQENKAKFKTADRIVGMLNVIREELPDHPLFYSIDNLFNIVHCTPCSMKDFRSALLNAGYRVSMSHTSMNSLKTDAPTTVIWDVLREWVKRNPVSEKRLIDGTPAKAILSKKQTTLVSFERHPEANPQSREKGLLRFQPNPEKFWGPKPRAKRNLDKGEDEESPVSKKTKEDDGEFAERKMKPCRHFVAKGYCNYGDMCQFLH